MAIDIMVQHWDGTQSRILYQGQLQKWSMGFPNGRKEFDHYNETPNDFASLMSPDPPEPDAFEAL